jgi:hypothetical protein
VGRTRGKKQMTYASRRLRRVEKGNNKILDTEKHFGRDCSRQHLGASIKMHGVTYRKSAIFRVSVIRTPERKFEM